MEDTDWSIHDLIVDTKNWWPGKKVLISPRWIRPIDWMDNMVNLNVDRQRVNDSRHTMHPQQLTGPCKKHFHKRRAIADRNRERKG